VLRMFSIIDPHFFVFFSLRVNKNHINITFCSIEIRHLCGMWFNRNPIVDRAGGQDHSDRLAGD